MLNVVRDGDVKLEEAKPGFDFIDTLFGIEVEPALRRFAQIRVRERGADTPTANRHYTFTKEHLLIVQFWLNDDIRDGIKNNLMLTGPTGSGKTTLVEQSAARTGFGCVKVTCHGDLDYEDLIGRYTLNQQGGMLWVDGPVVRAMREGHIVLLDEMNFLRPEVVGGLNGILDGGSLLIAGTGERVHPHRDFRIAATGNAIDGTDAGKYRGVKRQNDSLLDRFLLGVQLDYMDPEQEQGLISRMYQHLDKRVVETMMEVATATRLAQKNGDLAVAISTRVLLNGWARHTQRYGAQFEVQVQNLLKALTVCMLFRVPSDDRKTIEATITGLLKKKKYIDP